MTARLLFLAALGAALAVALLVLVDRLMGGHGPTVEIAPFDEPGGGW